ncbi:MAG: aldehyde dehydrogenase family protein [Aureliella sp.]
MSMTTCTATNDLARAIDVLRAAQMLWGKRRPKDRLRAIGRVAGLIAEHAEALAGDIVRPVPVSEGELLASELLPLAEACRYVARRGASVLARRRLPRRDAAWWMGSVGVWETRRPLGIVLLIGPSNYPLLLLGVQLVQALAAGNAVLIKPAPGCSRAIERLTDLCVRAGVPSELMRVLPTAPEAAREAIESGVDKVVLTGSYETGRAVARELAQSLTPAAFELSGNDAVFVLDDADFERVTKSVVYALRLNGGQTCIAPRRLFATRASLERLQPLLRRELEQSEGIVERRCCSQACLSPSIVKAREVIEEALADGAQLVCGDLREFEAQEAPQPIVLERVQPRMQVATEDLFAPVLSLIEVSDMATALEWSKVCRYALGASVFGSPAAATGFAEQVEAGCVTVNDVLVPTADPRVSFGGWGRSGYGVTRGLEGLREMTRLQVTCERRGRWLPHLSTDRANLAPLMRGLLLLRHGSSFGERWRGLKHLMEDNPLRALRASAVKELIEKQDKAND